MLATACLMWGGFQLEISVPCIECKSIRILHTFISLYNPILESNHADFYNLIFDKYVGSGSFGE